MYLQQKEQAGTCQMLVQCSVTTTKLYPHSIQVQFMRYSDQGKKYSFNKQSFFLTTGEHQECS